MKYKEMMTHVLFDTVPSWMKYHKEKDIRIVRKVYSIGDLCSNNDYDRLPSDMSKPPFEKLKRHLPSSSNLTLNNSTILSSTLGKLLVRKLSHRSTTDVTKSATHLYNNNNNYEQHDPSNLNKTMIVKENIQFIERIGEGKLGNVFKAFYRTKQNELLTVAVKKFHQEFNYNDISKEISIIRNTKHSYILSFFDVVIHTDQSIMFVMEYAQMKSLDICLLSIHAKSEYSIQILLDYLKQIASAMCYLEEKFLIHRNLSCRKFLVFNKSLIKLSDLGLEHLNTSWKDRLKLPIAWMSPEVIHFYHFTTASDVFSFGVSMWECFSYGEIPWKGMSNDEKIIKTFFSIAFIFQIINAIDAPNHQRLSRPYHATSELYQIMLQCWKYEPCERPTFSKLERQLIEIEIKQVRWKNNNNISTILPDDFLPIQSCMLGPLTVLDRCLDIPISSTSINNFIQCISADGQIGFVYNNNVEPLHVITIPKQTINTTSSTMNHIFYRKTGIKKNSTKTRYKQISKNMISSPQADFVHAFHIGIEGETFGDMAYLTNVEDTNLKIEPNLKESTMNLMELESTEQSSSLFDEVMQAFTEIYSETESMSLSEDNLLTRSTSPQSPVVDIQSTSFDKNQFSFDNMTDNRSPPFSRLLSKLTIKKPNETSCRFTRELEERSRNGDLSEQGKRAYNLLINRCTSNSSSQSSTHDEHSSFSSSSNQEKFDYHSHYSSISSLNSRSSSINKHEQNSITGQPLPPPPDLATLGSKLTTANMTHTFNLPASLISNKYPTKIFDYNLYKKKFMPDICPCSDSLDICLCCLPLDLLCCCLPCCRPRERVVYVPSAQPMYAQQQPMYAQQQPMYAPQGYPYVVREPIPRY
ncbi:unnamed protein product [Adineta steineri]|uniref:Uncharacterized protein n=1 Tax=Adineta steineri TaxID=433720 RepID=A0A819FCA5_9BILA|nr:unnamed protein product [Adineta steineri]